MILRALRRLLDLLLQALVILLMTAMFLVVTAGVVFRSFGSPLGWYDEVAPILLVWVTFYGAALAALHRRHLATHGLLALLPRGGRIVLLAVAEAAVFLFMALLAWYGMIVLDVFEGERLVSLRWVPIQFTQSAIPVGAILYMLAEIVSLPEHWRRIVDAPDLRHEVAAP